MLIFEKDLYNNGSTGKHISAGGFKEFSLKQEIQGTIYKIVK